MSNQFTIQSYILCELGLLKSYIELMEGVISEHHERLGQSYDDFLKKSDQEYSVCENDYESECIRLFGDWILDDQHAFYCATQHMRCGMLVSIMALVERWLADICKYLEEIYKFDISADDLKGNDYGSQIKYLTKVAKLNLDEDCLKKYKAYKIVRNYFAHDYANYFAKQLSKDKLKKLENAASCVTKVEVTNDEVWLTDGFCEEVICQITKFVENVYSAVKGMKTIKAL
jgi:hypothetical protein